MKINPYLYFNGNAAEAVAFYEKAFEGKAIVLRYKDAPSYDDAYKTPPQAENLVMHANMNLGDSMIMFCDYSGAPAFNSAAQLLVSTDSVEQTKRIFDALKAGGEVTMELQKTFWSAYFGSVKDKFGVCWLLDCEKEA